MRLEGKNRTSVVDARRLTFLISPSEGSKLMSYCPKLDPIEMSSHLRASRLTSFEFKLSLVLSSVRQQQLVRQPLSDLLYHSKIKQNRRQLERGQILVSFLPSP